MGSRGAPVAASIIATAELFALPLKLAAGQTLLGVPERSAFKQVLELAFKVFHLYSRGTRIPIVVKYKLFGDSAQCRGLREAL